MSGVLHQTQRPAVQSRMQKLRRPSTMAWEPWASTGWTRAVIVVTQRRSTAVMAGAAESVLPARSWCVDVWGVPLSPPLVPCAQTVIAAREAVALRPCPCPCPCWCLWKPCENGAAQKSACLQRRCAGNGHQTGFSAGISCKVANARHAAIRPAIARSGVLSLACYSEGAEDAVSALRCWGSREGRLVS